MTVNAFARERSEWEKVPEEADEALVEAARI
jgi:hypothetical protein